MSKHPECPHTGPHGAHNLTVGNGLQWACHGIYEVVSSQPVPVMPPTPELDEQSAAREAGSQEIGEFLQWLHEEKGYVIGLFVAGDQFPVVVYDGIDVLLADYFDTDLTKVEQERREILDGLRQSTD